MFVQSYSRVMGRASLPSRKEKLFRPEAVLPDQKAIKAKGNSLSGSCDLVLFSGLTRINIVNRR